MKFWSDRKFDLNEAKWAMSSNLEKMLSSNTSIPRNIFPDLLIARKVDLVLSKFSSPKKYKKILFLSSTHFAHLRKKVTKSSYNHPCE